MLCGLFGPTSGNAIIDGYRMSDNMSDIHKVMGVCPQDNGEKSKALFLFLLSLRLIDSF